MSVLLSVAQYALIGLAVALFVLAARAEISSRPLSRAFVRNAKARGVRRQESRRPE